jgi:DnaA family protein
LSAVAALRQIPLALGSAPPASFDTFVVGTGQPANAGAVEHLRTRGAPVYLWGPRGGGKTHLLQALARHAGSVAWFDAAVTPLPWQADDAALIVLDTCDALVADGARQQAAFALFIDAASRGAAVASAARVPPVDLHVRDDLRTRLAASPVFALEPLPDAHVREVLLHEARRRGIEVADEVLDYLLTRFSRDLKHLMALLDRLDRFALAEHRAVTVPLLKKMFEEEGASL